MAKESMMQILRDLQELSLKIASLHERIEQIVRPVTPK